MRDSFNNGGQAYKCIPTAKHMTSSQADHANGHGLWSG